MKEMITSTQDRMLKSLEQLGVELAKIRTGRANSSLIEGLEVSCYGAISPLSQVASITVEDARTLAVSPWDKSLIGDIEKAIMNSNLGLNPASQGDTIRIPLPPLSEERRKEFVKLAKSTGESSKISVRNIRRDMLEMIKVQVKDKDLTEDDEHRLKAEIQIVTDKIIEKIDSQVSEKETDLLKI
jgi:ribosome recycling factor